MATCSSARCGIGLRRGSQNWLLAARSSPVLRHTFIVVVARPTSDQDHVTHSTHRLGHSYLVHTRPVLGRKQASLIIDTDTQMDTMTWQKESVSTSRTISTTAISPQSSRMEACQSTLTCPG